MTYEHFFIFSRPTEIQRNSLFLVRRVFYAEYWSHDHVHILVGFFSLTYIGRPYKANFIPLFFYIYRPTQ